MKLTCIITDDEPVALDILEDYLRMVPGCELAARCSNVLEAFSALHKYKPDVMFIDIKMPEVNGLDFVRSLKQPPKVVFTTAYPIYAVDGFELNAADYLLKPFSFERFLKAMDKLYIQNQQPVNTPPPANGNNQVSDNQSFFVKSGQGFTRIYYDDILYVEGLENYVKIVSADKTVITLSTMRNIESLLPASSFMRVHRSFIINLNHVESFQENTFRIKEKSIVIGKSYRKLVLDNIRQHFSFG